MNICVLGWYYDKDFMKVLEQIHSKYPVHIVAHRENGVSKLPTTLIDNVGLEFGGYDYYLKNIWDGKSSVFFTHDDIYVTDISVFDTIAEIKRDLSYIFYNTKESVSCLGAHGRAMFASPKFLSFIKRNQCKCTFSKEDGVPSHTGFYFDKKNLGKNTGYNDVIMDYTKSYGDDGYNRGIKHMYHILRYLKSNQHLYDTTWNFGENIIPDYQYGYRGTVGIDALVAEVNNLISQDSGKLERHYKPL
jgi:hypothetical protein